LIIPLKALSVETRIAWCGVSWRRDHVIVIGFSDISSTWRANFEMLFSASRNELEIMQSNSSILNDRYLTNKCWNEAEMVPEKRGQDEGENLDTCVSEPISNFEPPANDDGKDGHKTYHDVEWSFAFNLLKWNSNVHAPEPSNQ